MLDRFLREKVTKEQLDKLYASLPFSLSAITLLSTLIGFIFFVDEKSSFVLPWLLFMLVIVAARWFLKKRYESEPDPDITLYYRLFLIFVFLSGVGFASLIYMVFPHNIFDLILFVFVMAGLSAGAISTLYYSKTAVILY